ncbi:MAG: ThuA domain-containing protein [Planctomycetales bacterium]|nr:ThuA domain-containing protein [Planctomycetales bacterium]
MSRPLFICFALLTVSITAQWHLQSAVAADSSVLHFSAKEPANGKVVLVAGDEEYRSEESMPMLAKILSVHHGFDCTVLFSMSEDGTYVDPNHSAGIVGWEALDDADLMIIGTRFRTPSESQAAHITRFIDAGKPLIGIRTATHAFNGKGSFGGDVTYGSFGRKILGEQWVSHHGQHKRQGARGVLVDGTKNHPILNSVTDVFAPSDVYGVTHLTDDDTILLRAAVTESLDPKSANIDGAKNDPMQPFAWLHHYVSPNGTKGQSFCTTAGASVDLVNEDLRRMIVNAVYFLTEKPVPEKADVSFVDPFYRTFFGFINDKEYWANLGIRPTDFAIGKSPHYPDPKGSPEWPFRDRPEN